MHTKICKRNKTTNYLKRFHFFTRYDVEYNILSVCQYPITQIVCHLFCEGTKPSFFFAVNNELLCLRCTVSSVSYNMDVVSNNKGQIDTLSTPRLTINGWLTLTLSHIMVTLLLELAASVSIAEKSGEPVCEHASFTAIYPLTVPLTRPSHWQWYNGSWSMYVPGGHRKVVVKGHSQWYSAFFKRALTHITSLHSPWTRRSLNALGRTISAKHTWQKQTSSSRTLRSQLMLAYAYRAPRSASWAPFY